MSSLLIDMLFRRGMSLSLLVATLGRLGVLSLFTPVLRRVAACKAQRGVSVLESVSRASDSVALQPSAPSLHRGARAFVAFLHCVSPASQGCTPPPAARAAVSRRRRARWRCRSSRRGLPHLSRR